MKKLLLIVMVCVSQEPCCQLNKGRDSLRSLLINGSNDTVMALRFFNYGETFETENLDSAFFYYNKGKQLSDELDYFKGKLAYVSYSIYVLNNQGRFKEALQLCVDILPSVEKKGNKQDLAAIYINLGSEWQYLSNFDAGALYYLKAIKLAEELGHKHFLRVAYNNLASVFNSLQQYEKGKKYANKSLIIAKEMNNDYAIASSTINIATSASFLKQHDQSLEHFKEVELLGVKLNDKIIIMDGWLGMADNLVVLNNGNDAVKYYNKVIETAIGLNAPEYEMYGIMGLSKYLLEVKNYTRGEEVILKGIQIARQLGTGLELKELYLRASELSEATGNSISALQWHKQFVALNDSILNEKNIANINFLEIEYETEKKEQQLQLQLATIRQKNTLNYILIGSFASLLLISILAYRTYKQKKILQEQKILKLEKEKLLLATQSILKGQEDERSRLAKDLHDGLGGLLSGVKLQLGAMKGNLILSEQHGRIFNNALVKLDESISEMRRVAHNMMPEALMKLGLQQALQDYCEGLSELPLFNINYEFHGLENRMEASVEIVVYRIVQELLNNALKHSGATSAFAQVIRNDNTLSITVEDNGKGFDITNSDASKAGGLANVKSRVDYLKGHLDIKSELEKGTSIHIECIING